MNGYCQARTAALALLCAVTMLPAGAQPFGLNVDLDLDGPPEVGGGAPSPLFGAAAGQTGYWNAMHILALGPRELRTLDGQLSGVIATAEGIATGGGWCCNGNSGDFTRLLNDATQVGTDRAGPASQWTLRGFPTGWYAVYTYAVKPNGQYGIVDVLVPNSNHPNPQRVEGIMPGNRFERGVTHSIHHVFTADGVIQIRAGGPWPNAFVNGFQIVPVTEPCALLALAVFSIALVSSKTRRKMRRTGVE